MDKRTYEATGRKLRAAYEALEKASLAAELGDRAMFGRAQDELRASADTLRLRFCKECDKNGMREDPKQPGWQRLCEHPAVESYLPELCAH